MLYLHHIHVLLYITTRCGVYALLNTVRRVIRTEVRSAQDRYVLLDYFRQGTIRVILLVILDLCEPCSV
jgi:hypothetical protein